MFSRLRLRSSTPLTIVALLALVLSALPFGVADADAQATGITIVPNLADGTHLLGSSVVVSGAATAASGIADVTIQVQDVTSGRWMLADGTDSAVAVDLDAWTALLPPVGEPGVSWRVPLTLADGDYTVTIRAVDTGGSTAAAGPVAFTVTSTALPPSVLLAEGSVWAYDDRGVAPVDPTSPATPWYDPAFDDASWSLGPAQLGFGEGDEATTTSEIGSNGSRVTTQYFRHTFSVANPATLGDVVLEVFRDDGAVIYLNGAELGRTNMPDGTITPWTWASSSSEQLISFDVPPSLLQAGDNLLAVEVHQFDPASTDLSFDASMIAYPPSRPLIGDNTPGTYLLTAGDMARCSYEGDEVVAAQMSELFDTDAGVFLGLGDLVYNSGTINEFLDCYDPTIGQFKDVTWPSPGNHEHYTTPNAAGYRQYFGAAAGPFAGPSGGLWYSFDLDDSWHVIALDSDCRGVEPIPGGVNGDGCAVGSEQEQWLRADLEANQDKNILAFFHHPPYTNNRYVDHDYTWPLWRALVEYGVDITLHGHEHHYERYAPLDYWGERTTESAGTRQFIIGSGGTFPRYNERSQESESDFRGTFPVGSNDFGVLQLWLRPDGYDWRWESIYGLAAVDEGSSGLTAPMVLAAIAGGTIDAETGLPMSGATVCVTADRTGLETCTTTAATGAWSIDALVSDTYTVTAEIPGQTSLETTTVTLTAPTNASVANFELSRLAAISGTVTSEGGGAAVSNATVCARSLTDGSVACANTTVDGDYEIADLAPDDYVVEFRATGFVSECFDDNQSCASPTSVTMDGANRSGVDAVLEFDPGAMSGVVTAQESGDPLADIEVCAESSRYGTFCAVTDTDGAYRIDLLRTDNWIVRFTDPSGARLEECYRNRDCSRPTPVGVLAPGERTGIDASLTLLATPTPTPSPTATSTPTPTPTPTPTTMAEPTATTTSTPTPTPTPEVTPTAQPVSGGGSIEGRISLFATDQPIFGAIVCAIREGWGTEFCTFSRTDGSYLIDDLPTGNYQVHVADRLNRYLENCYGNLACASPASLGVTSSISATGIDLKLDTFFTAGIPTPTPTPEVFGSGEIHGSVTRVGSPVAGVQVCAESLRRSFVECAVTAGDGSYQIGRLATDNYRVVFDGTTCYLDNSGCTSPIPIGVVSGFTRVGIDASL